MDFENLSLEEALTSEELLIYSRNLATPQGYIHQLLFPQKQTSSLTINTLKNSTNLPVMAQIAELGTEVKYGSREGMSGDQIAIPKIQRGRYMDEKLVRILLEGGVRRSELDEIRREQLNDGQYCVDAIVARREWIAIQAAFLGRVQYTEDNVQVDVDYGYEAAQKPVLSGTDLWSDHTNSTPITDMQTWKEERGEKGIILSRALTSQKIVSNLLQNMSIRHQYFGNPSGTATPPQLNRSQLNTVLTDLELPMIATYDTQVRTENNALTGGKLAFTTARFSPQNRFLMLPDGPLGDYLWAQTTEEMMAEIDAEQTGDMGIFVFRDWTKNPIRLRTAGVALCFPSYPWADSVVSATVI
jgi:hypothetical protein